MNIFKSLIGKVWQDPNAAEVVKIPTGQLYLVRPGSIRGGRECIFNEAMATIRRVPSVEHHFQLVITRVLAEGEEELLEDEDETDEEKCFLIAEDLQFRTGELDGEPTFIWRDLEGGEDECYEYVAPGTNAPTRAFFETCMYRAMYERKYKKSADNLPDSAFDEFVYSSGKPGAPPPRKTVASGSAVVESSSGSTSPESPHAALLKQVDVIFTAQDGELWFWNKIVAGFEQNQTDVTVQLVKNKTEYTFWLVAVVDDEILIAHRISPSMNQRLAAKLSSFTWNHVGEEGEVNSWLVRFASSKEYENFVQSFTEALWQTLHQTPWAKIKPDERDYVMSSYDEDVEMQDVEGEEDEEEEVLSELEPDEDSDEAESEEEDEDGKMPTSGDGAANSQLTVGYKGDRSYVVRGPNIGVFGQSTDGDGVKYRATINKLATPGGKVFTPKHVMLHDQDTRMIVMNSQEPNSLFHLDLERGQIVEEWKVHDDITVDNIAPQNKFAQTTGEQTFVGTSHNALFRVDPRVSGTKLVDSQYKQYVSKNKFSGVATTAKGGLAVASEKGDIRLFDSIGKNAKTALPPLGDPIIGIDVTADGRWVIGTTKTYLLLIDTLIGEGRYQGSLGFDRSFPATAKPIPRRLQLRTEHMAYMNHDISFTPARSAAQSFVSGNVAILNLATSRFNQGEGQEENAIVTSTGQYVIAWDFAKVKKGQLDRYEIKKYEDRVVQDNFKFGDDKEIIVALQNNVLAVNKKQLKKPTRHSLGATLGPSRSSIVNSPY